MYAFFSFCGGIFTMTYIKETTDLSDKEKKRLYWHRQEKVHVMSDQEAYSIKIKQNKEKIKGQ